MASGWAIAATTRTSLLERGSPSDKAAFQSQALCGENFECLTAEIVAKTALNGNPLALAAFRRATSTLGWAIAQMVTLLAPEVIVVGGGVSQSGEKLFFVPIREEVERYVFPMLKGSYEIVPSMLGESAVVEGAVLLAHSEIG